MREIIIEAVLIFFTLYGAGCFAYHIFRYAENCGTEQPRKSKLKLKHITNKTEAKEIISKYTA